ncbi:MAG TPA: universal stress protein [Desulfosarcina sp.]|nr:universal stress protein [Desulfosarcina sp.]
MYQTILVPLDGSPRAEAILPHVEQLALRYGARVLLLHVDAEPPLLLERDEVVDLQGYMAQCRQRQRGIDDYLQRIIADWQNKGIAAERRLGRGPVVATIIETAARAQADLVAMASHGRSGWDRTFYGSVSAGVLQQIDRPLLIVRSQPVK